jgi:hypothetical protein
MAAPDGAAQKEDAMRTSWKNVAAGAIGTGMLVVGAAIPFAAAAQDAPVDAIRYDFTDELVRGDLVRPDLDMDRVRTRRPRSTLIRAREAFVAELYKSVENL